MMWVSILIQIGKHLKNPNPLLILKKSSSDAKPKGLSFNHIKDREQSLQDCSHETSQGSIENCNIVALSILSEHCIGDPRKEHTEHEKTQNSFYSKLM